MKHFLLLSHLIFGIFILAACAAAEPTPIPMAEFSLQATDIAYDKDLFEVVVGQPVKLTLHNDGVLKHDFNIVEIPHSGEVMAEEMQDEEGDHNTSDLEMDPGVNLAAGAGGIQSVEFTPTEAGEYEFYCTVSSHKAAGMVGTLVVKES
jgi:uncharacterized cupredoxin-like copper-binding protein